MKENSIEEDMRILERIDVKYFMSAKIEQSDYMIDKADEVNNAIEHILSDYKRVLKENEELKSNNEKYIIHLTDEQYKTVIENAQNDINQKWIQKVKDKIEELQNGPLKINENNKYYYETEAYNKIIIQVLQKLLEGRK